VRSVQSLQRLLFGYGFPAVALYILMLCAPALALLRARPSHRMQRAVALTLPIAAVVMVLAGVYKAAWTDPGVAAAYWAMVVAASAPADDDAAPAKDAP